MEAEMDRPCSTHGEDEKCIQNVGWNHSEYLGIDGRII
jgi:hypothetical protein